MAMEIRKKVDKLLGQILVERGMLSNTQLKEVLENQETAGGLIGDIIVKLGFAKEEDIAHCLSIQYGFTFLPLENYEISLSIATLISEHLCSHYCLIPIDKIDNTLTVAMANPLNIQAIDDLEDITHCDIQIFVSTPSDIRNCIRRIFGKEA
ncbi:MAG: hypothetical protein GF375_07615 [Candidatus Omnitrophica bacterium]|nr:hypothetical protein [Candidatus Omnitrophota bacterium]MBD3269838.1 hypothetical protein [Candidatus Omnitrophota bacterium]